MIIQVENSDIRQRHKESWELINKITGRKTAKKGLIKGNSKEDRVSKWYDHFNNLLGKEPLLTEKPPPEDLEKILYDLNIKDDDFNIEELQKAKSNLSDGKTPGSDNITSQIIKCDFDNIILEFSNKLLNDNVIPDQWSEIDMIPLPKTGDLSETSNYRGISIASQIAKTVNKMILNRIIIKVDKHLRKNQNGFRPGRSTTSHILALRRLIEEVQNRNLKAIILYVDFRKAFDSIHRGMMMKILKAYDIPTKILAAINTMYQKTRARVITPDGETKYFEIKAGVLQGDTLAPYLFVIVLDYIMRKTYDGKEEQMGFEVQKKQSRRIPAITVTDLDFADDLAVITKETNQAQLVLTKLENEAGKVGLHCNAKKTELQAFNQEQPVNVKSRDGIIIKEVENFKYLGAWMESSDKDISVRKALAWNACHKLRKGDAKNGIQYFLEGAYDK